ncbi:MAG TPA: nuclear transport factor 2 family protein [Pseudonocardia sp.]
MRSDPLPVRPGPRRLADRPKMLAGMTTLESTTNDAAAIHTLATRYAKAWNDHDVPTIMSMHAEKSVFHLHVAPYPEATTHEAIREQFSTLFEIMPDMWFDTSRLTVRDGLFVHEWTITTTLARPFPVGDRVAQPDGRRISFPGMDSIPCVNGLIARKDCYLDAVTLISQLTFG